MNSQQCWKAKLERPHFFKVQSGKITVCKHNNCRPGLICWKILSVRFFLAFIFMKMTSEVLNQLKLYIIRCQFSEEKLNFVLTWNCLLVYNLLVQISQNLKFLRCSNNLMQIMTSITPSTNKTIHQKVFFKNFEQKFWPLWRF